MEMKNSGNEQKTFVPLSIEKEYWDVDGKIMFLDKLYELQLTEEERQLLDYTVVSAYQSKLTYEQFEKIKKEISLVLISKLNEYHKVEFDEVMWGKLFSGWLDDFILNTYSKIEALENFRKTFGSGKCYTISPSNELPKKFLTPYPNRYGDDLYNHYIYADVANKFFDFDLRVVVKGGENIHDVYDKPTLYRKSFLSRLRGITLKKLLKYFNRKFTKLLFFSNMTNQRVLIGPAVYFPGDVLTHFVKKSWGKVGVLQIHDFDFNYINKDTVFRDNLRNTIETSVTVDKTTKMIMALIPDYLPFFYIEVFPLYLSYSQEFLKKHKKLRHFHTTCLTSKELFAFLMIYAQKQGLTISTEQHGGNYGFGEYVYDREAIVTDFFYGWGEWTQDVYNSPAKFLRSPTYRLSALYDGKKSSKEFILYVGSYIEPYTSGNFEVIRRGLSSNTEYINRQIMFFSRLNSGVKENLLVRNCWVDLGYHIDSILKEKFPDLSIQGYRQENYTTAFNPEARNSNFSDTFLRCSLCIYDDIESPFTEALYCHKPFILLLDPNRYSFRKEEMFFVKMMEDIGLIYYDTNKASELINSIYQDIDGWWLDEKRQKVVTEIRNRYVTDSTEIKEFWTKEFNCYAGMGNRDNKE